MGDGSVKGSPQIEEVYKEIEALARLTEYQKEFFRRNPEAFDDD